MATGQTIHDLLPIAAGSQVTTANTVLALRLAIEESWPRIRFATYNATASTFSSGTFDYDLSALTDITRDMGIGWVFAAPDNANDGPVIIKRKYRVYMDSSDGWHVVFPTDVVEKHNGKSLGVAYWSKHADISAIGDTVNLPTNYLVYFCSWWYAFYAMSEPESGRGTYTDRLVVMENRWKEALLQNETPEIFQSPSSFGTDRMFGQRSIYDNPTGKYRVGG